MIEIGKFQGTSLRSGKQGDLFLPREPSDPSFIVGKANQFDVAVCLAEDFKFADLETWQRRGLIVRERSIFIDPASRLAAHSPDSNDLPLGSIVVLDERVAIVAKGRHGTPHYVMIYGAQIADEDAGVTAFKGWAISVRNDAGDWEALYKNGHSTTEWICSLNG